ncbi:amino acid permease-domain-containing protein [Gigaspora rosea]|uniref:Amino acid permease-domain-containing protein n=1 Tax=Gigaspora rosea TaxID=44941 RepID=A0A397TW47_9GLOM|nr:amino acid permease-domain-containing protein [Gigaspora rosea]CAG8730930.1 8777_t:CDS:2 [Gigaspora rosea]
MSDTSDTSDTTNTRPTWNYKFITSGAPKQPNESKFKYNVRKLFTTKTLKSLEEDQNASKLKKDLSVFELTMIGLGSIIGTGIFVLTGQAAATRAGPAVVLSFLLAGLTASFAALSYSELASMIPISGSSYTYTYATMGELIAWIIGWDLTLEYLVGAATVAVGWSGYFVRFFYDAFGVQFSSSWTSAPITFNNTSNSFELTPGAYFNVPAFTIVVLLTILLVVGIKESARVNAIVVSVKVVVIIIFVIAAATRINPENYKPFIPPNEGSFSRFGVTGILAGTSIVFFAFIGFDSISTIAQESKNPQRDLPLSIMGSFSIVSVIYVAVCVVLTGVVSYKKLDSPAPISVAVNETGMKWLGVIVDLGAVDGLFLPGIASKVHPRFGTPHIITIIGGVICSIAAALFPIEVLAELTSVGTLLAFFLVNIGVTILRFKAPDAPRKFKVPGGPFLIPMIGAVLTLLILVTASPASLARLFIWMAIGLIVYTFHGRRRSKANNAELVNKENKEEGTEMRLLNEGGEQGENVETSRRTRPTTNV